MSKITGVITLEDSTGYEIEFDDITSHPKLLLFPKDSYPDLKQGDIVQIVLIKISD